MSQMVEPVLLCWVMGCLFRQQGTDHDCFPFSFNRQVARGKFDPSAPGLVATHFPGNPAIELIR